MELHRLSTILLCAAALSTVAMAQERLAASSHVSGTQPFHATITGTCTNKDDFSFTGTPPGLAPGGALRIYCVVAGDSTHGRYNAQILAEGLVTANTCTSGGAGGVVGVVKAYVFVLSFTGSQDQLFLNLGSAGGSECLTPPGAIAAGQTTLNVAGGTGRFAGATGTLANRIAPIALAFSALGGDGFFSAFSGELEGFITLK